MGQWLVAGLTVLLMSCGGGREVAPAGRVAHALQEPVAAVEQGTDPAEQMQDDLYALRYIASYGDLIQALGPDAAAARAHYAATGRAEGRTVSFDPTAYTASYGDLIRAFGVDALAATRHYIVYGWREGRRPTFDALRYEASYGDLIRTYGLDTAAATQHYVAHGFAEGRTSTFDALRYEASYADLIVAFGPDPAAATRHYIVSGFAEGRTSTFDTLRYVASYADLIAAFGLDREASTWHYVGWGYREGRRIAFDPARYVAGYPDLQAAFGSDGEAATRHFIEFGHAEGRRPLPAPPVLTLEERPVKVFRFSWADVPYATEYRLLEDPSSTSGYGQIASIAPGAGSRELPVSLPRRVHARYILKACGVAGCADSAAVAVTGSLAAAVGYVKASNTGAGDRFSRVALSADGSTLAVGAEGEDSSATGIDGNQGDKSAVGSGAVYIFARSGAGWSQQAYVKASNAAAGDGFGVSLALSADGSTLAVGASLEDSRATGVNGDQADNSAGSSGAVYVFTRSGTTWSQQAYVKASNTGANDLFGHSLALSADGDTLAVGAIEEDSSATGIDGHQGDNAAIASGAVYVFTRGRAGWSQQAYVKASNAGAVDNFGESVALSADGNTLAVGAGLEDSNASGVNGDQANNLASDSGAVYVFTRSGTTWSQQAYLKASHANPGDYFGISVALSGDGDTLAVGAVGEDSSATGINGNQGDNSAPSSGAVFVFKRSGATWGQQAYLKAGNSEAGDGFGRSLALSADGNELAVGAGLEDSNASGVNGDQANNLASDSGAVCLFARSGTGIWSQSGYLKASNTGAHDHFGASLAMSADGSTLSVGADGEASNATGVNGNQGNNSANGSGAVYLF